MKRSILDNPPIEETKLKMLEFFMETLVPRVLAARKTEVESKKEGEKHERSIIRK
ncbi:TPA: hypothetical protein QCX59_001182 [Bacillus mycoides]|nr:hypothetical protein [Bacillus mycoides]